mgnify:CR=1 FL=1
MEHQPQNLKHKGEVSLAIDHKIRHALQYRSAISYAPHEKKNRNVYIGEWRIQRDRHYLSLSKFRAYSLFVHIIWRQFR